MASVLIGATFYFLAQSGNKVNAGIISSIFSTNLIFVCILFYLFYGQVLSARSIVGIVMIMTSVVVISMNE